MNSSTLYPAIEPFARGRLAVDSLHTLYFEQAGNPEGVPAVYLHGGPGSPTSARHHRLFDPAHYRIVLFEQRGVGRSSPLAETRDNTTWHLVADMERLREHLGIARWHVSGGSWGSTLALAYAQGHPARCLSLTLRGIFLCSAEEIGWFLHGMGHFFPEAAQQFRAAIAEEERGDLLEAYGRLLGDADPAVHMPAARAWADYEGACVSLLPQAPASRDDESDSKALTLARLENHYFRHRGWLQPGQLLAGVGAIRKIPAVIVQGRYDVVCPPSAAFALGRAWPEAAFVMVPDAGHAVTEPGITAALVAASDRFRSLA
ncbi:MAG: prolyl aminopeptidase [Proteobacteria bacterium]|nr:prolyl aminopeptidase [Pseudomonadota bacterium]